MMKRLLFIAAFLLSAGRLPAQDEPILSVQDRRIIATCMVLEAGGEGPEGMQAVLNVILNRAEGSLNGMVAQTVKPGAFSCMSAVWCKEPDFGALFRKAENQPEPYVLARQLLDQLEEGRLADNSHGATHYHSTSVTPYWIRDMHYLKTIGNHIFYIERKLLQM